MSTETLESRIATLEELVHNLSHKLTVREKEIQELKAIEEIKGYRQPMHTILKTVWARM